MNRGDLDIEQNADRRVFRGTLVVCAALLATNFLVNSTSIIMEQTRGGADFREGLAWFTEGTSSLVILGLYPLVLLLERRFPVGETAWQRALPVYAVGLLVFSIVHIIGMFSLRAIGYPLLFDIEMHGFPDPARTFVYEFRKDAMTFAGPLLIAWGFRSIEQHRMDAAAARRDAKETQRLTLKCGGRVVRMEAEGFIAAKAAGNYVEVTFRTGEHLARMTLVQLLEQLRAAGIDAVRCHRSWVVNQTSVQQIDPTGEGDHSITLDSGAKIPCSRRYRDQLVHV